MIIHKFSNNDDPIFCLSDLFEKHPGIDLEETSSSRFFQIT